MTGHLRVVMNHVGVACAGRMSVGLGGTRQRPSRQRDLREVVLVAVAALGLLAAAAPVSAQETVEYYGTDALGSVRAVFDQTGGVIARADYMPFGEEVSAPGPVPVERFTGQARDGEVGKDYFHARALAPGTGRFNAPDPISRIAGISTGSVVHRQEQHRAGVVSAQSCAGGRHPDPAPPVGAMVFRHSRVTTRAIFVLAVVMVSPSRAWAQDPSMTPPPQDLPVEVLVPPPPAVEMAAPSLPTGPGALQALRDGDGMALEVTPGARLRLPASAGTVFDRRWGVIAGADVRVSATFLAGSATAQYGLVLGLPPGAEYARRGVACVVSPAGRVRLLVRTGDVDPEDLPWTSLPDELVTAVAPGQTPVLALAAKGDTVACAVNGTVVATLPRDATTASGVPGLWTAGTGSVTAAGFTVELRQR